MDALLSLEGGEHDKRAISLGTRKTKHINNQMRPEADANILKDEVEKFQAAFPEQLFLRSLSATYNCVGMVFATRRTWVDPDYIHQFLSDDEYQQIHKREAIEVGDIVVYRHPKNGITHVGIIIERKDDILNAEIGFKVLSKWGSAGEFVHKMETVPSTYGVPAEYWTDRKIP